MVVRSLNHLTGHDPHLGQYRLTLGAAARRGADLARRLDQYERRLAGVSAGRRGG